MQLYHWFKAKTLEEIFQPRQEGGRKPCENKNNILRRGWHEMRPEAGKVLFIGGNQRRSVWQEKVGDDSPSEDENMGREDVRPSSLGGVRGIGGL